MPPKWRRRASSRGQNCGGDEGEPAVWGYAGSLNLGHLGARVSSSCPKGERSRADDGAARQKLREARCGAADSIT